MRIWADEAAPSSCNKVLVSALCAPAVWQAREIAWMVRKSVRGAQRRAVLDLLCKRACSVGVSALGRGGTGGDAVWTEWEADGSESAGGQQLEDETGSSCTL